MSENAYGICKMIYSTQTSVADSSVWHRTTMTNSNHFRKVSDSSEKDTKYNQTFINIQICFDYLAKIDINEDSFCSRSHSHISPLNI